MNNQDYEKKKQERWRIYAGAFDIKDEIPNEAFNWVFDRAYALGKQEIKQESRQETDAEETVISGWVAVDDITFDRCLRVHKVTQGDYEAVWDSGEPEFCLGEELFPDMTPNSDPEEVEIIIKRKRNERTYRRSMAKHPLQIYSR